MPETSVAYELAMNHVRARKVPVWGWAATGAAQKPSIGPKMAIMKPTVAEPSAAPMSCPVPTQP